MYGSSIVRPIMSGRRLNSFRSGDRSEYLAQYGLSRFSFVQPFLRQEDFGVVDFVCTLMVDRTESDGQSYSYPENAFYVQVKSNTNPITYDEPATIWISKHMQLPLFFCIVNKKESGGGEISLYSSSIMWEALTLRPNASSITVLFDGTPDVKFPDGDKDNGRLDVQVGEPILQKNLDDLEGNPADSYSAIKPWVQNDMVNITNRNLGRVLTKRFKKWESNVAVQGEADFRYYRGPNYQPVETYVFPHLAALAYNYKCDSKLEKLNALKSFLEKMDLSKEAKNELFSQLDSIGPTAGPACPTGPIGPTGPTGPTGP